MSLNYFIVSFYCIIDHYNNIYIYLLSQDMYSERLAVLRIVTREKFFFFLLHDSAKYFKFSKIYRIRLDSRYLNISN